MDSQEPMDSQGNRGLRELSERQALEAPLACLVLRERQELAERLDRQEPQVFLVTRETQAQQDL